MSKHTIKGYVTYDDSDYLDKPEISFRTWIPDPGSWPNTVVVFEHSIEVEVPDDFDPRPKVLDRLNEQLQTVRAENQQRENAILDQISKLQALAMEVEA